jgi:small basic protein
MASDIQLLELASGIKDSLVRAGFLTIESILSSGIADLSSKVGVDLYIAQIILQAARKFGTAAPVANL